MKRLWFSPSAHISLINSSYIKYYFRNNTIHYLIFYDKSQSIKHGSTTFNLLNPTKISISFGCHYHLGFTMAKQTSHKDDRISANYLKKKLMNSLTIIYLKFPLNNYHRDLVRGRGKERRPLLSYSIVLFFLRYLVII